MSAQRWPRQEAERLTESTGRPSARQRCLCRCGGPVRRMCSLGSSTSSVDREGTAAHVHSRLGHFRQG
eukprot:2290959-Alexandrium_andersonii.AAC.1